MKKTISTIIVLFALLGICSGVWADGRRGNQSAPRWAGIYAGVIPAADGPGISVVAILNADMTYRITYQYIGRDTELFVFTGTFEWDDRARTITLDSRALAPYYRAGRNSLTQLDMEGKKITGPLAGNYRLRRVRTP